MSSSRLALRSVGVLVLPLVCLLVSLILLTPLVYASVPVVEPVGYQYQNYAPVVRVGHFSTKKGLGTHYPGLCEVRRFGASWQYAWHYNVDRCPRAEGVPMIYNAFAQELVLGGWEELGGNSDFILGYNEPDREDQANLFPQEAAVLWRELEVAFPDKKLVSPAVSQEDQDWLVRFYAAYFTLYGTAPRMDGGLAGHCYYADYDHFRRCADRLIEYARRWGITGGVWITEFAPIKIREEFSQQEMLWESLRVLRWLERSPYIVRYAWFPTRLSGEEPWVGSVDDWCVLADYDTGQLTPWGWLYSRGGVPDATEIRESIASAGSGVCTGYGNRDRPGYCATLGGGFLGQP